ncbi:MAG TPA: hypothetical protein VEZ90_11390 [Blastocatellia bacterium]|nr:hypothetical protein [Blastocatellia bacterium]
MGDDLNRIPLDPRESLLWDRTGSGAGVHLNSPAGGPGPGYFRQTGPEVPTAPRDPNAKGSFWDRLYYEAVKAGIRAVGQTVGGPAGGLLVDYFLYRYRKNSDQVIEACQRALSKYVAGAIEEETGRALSGLLTGLLQGLIVMMAVVAVTTLIGAGAGAALGALCFGVGAAPGAAAGAEVGFDAGIWILEWIGIGFLALYVGSNLKEVVRALGHGVVRAWNAGERGATKEADIDAAAREIAHSIAILIRLILEAIVLYLLQEGVAGVSKRLPEVLKALRESKLGKGFADWVEKNYQEMIGDPKLNPKLRQSRPTKAEGADAEAAGRGAERESKPRASRGKVVSREEAFDILKKSGMSDARAKDFVRSFDDGPITVRTVDPGEQFYRYSGVPDGSGSFLTTQSFSSPDAAVKGLHLEDYGNPATFKQTVTATEPSVVLEGGVRGGNPPGSPQTLITDRGAFDFGTGTSY